MAAYEPTNLIAVVKALHGLESAKDESAPEYEEYYEQAKR
jgi:hypothetical protein